MLGRVGKETDEEDGEADDIALPFSPEVGTATAFAGGFAVGALLPAKGGATAVVVLLSPETALARKIELGKVHGDVPPPHVAAAGSSLLVAVPDGAPHGTLVRIARLDDAHYGSPNAGAEVPQGVGESEAFALEVGKQSAVLAWDEWDAKNGQEVIKTVSFSPSTPQKTTPPVVVSPPKIDAEAPRLVRRASGFWAAWIASPTKDPKPEDERGKDKEREPDLAPRPEPQFLMLAPLDAVGAPAGAPLVVTSKSGHVTAFDFAPAKDDGALIAFRDAVTSDEQTPGGTVRVVLVRADGTIEPRALVEEDVGSGVPLLLPDEAAPAGVAGFLAVAGDSGAVRLSALDDSGRGRDALAPEPALGVATPLAAQRGSLFVARPHGGGLELGLLACSAGPAPAR